MDVQKNKKDFILQTAANFFYLRGINLVSMDDIAKKCSISKKTIYIFFESKAHMVEEVLERDFLLLHKKIDELQVKAPNALVELFLLFGYLSEIYVKTSQVYLNDLKRIPSQTYITAYYDSVQFFLIENFYRGKKEGLYKSMDDIQSDIQSFRRFINLLFFEGDTTKSRACQNIEIMTKLYALYVVSEQGNHYLKELEKDLESYKFS